MNHAEKVESGTKCNQSKNLTHHSSVCLQTPSGASSLAQPDMGGVPFIIVMAKDPAFLFYYQDFLVGTEFMTAEEVGCYIRILCHLAHKGKLSKEHMISICRGYVFSPTLESKFKLDENGFYYNERLAFEVEKRRLYSLSRKKNASKAYAEHMENENENINKINKEDENFDAFWEQYPRKVGKEAAIKAWIKLSPKGELLEKILEGLTAAKQEWVGKEERYIPHASTWLNGKRWEDDYTREPKSAEERIKRIVENAKQVQKAMG